MRARQIFRMSRPTRTRPRARVQAIGLTILAHAAAVMLIWVERRAPQEVYPQGLQYFSIWPEARVEPQPDLAAGAERPREKDKPAESVRRTDMAPLHLLTPPNLDQPDQKRAIDPGNLPLKPQVDWNAAAVSAAARIAEDASSNAFSTAPQPLREPCKPRVFDEETKQLMTGRLPIPSDPDAVGPDPKANCIIVGGLPKCVQKFTAKVGRGKPAGDLFKDRLAGKQPPSSVPSPDVCD